MLKRKHEQEKKRQYNAKVIEIEHATFTPTVLTIKGVMGQECKIYYKAFAEKLSAKLGKKFEIYQSKTLIYRTKISVVMFEGFS